MANFGPSTTNEALAAALREFLEDQGAHLHEDHYDAINEAADRIGEMPDEEN